MKIAKTISTVLMLLFGLIGGVLWIIGFNQIDGLPTVIFAFYSLGLAGIFLALTILLLIIEKILEKTRNH